MSRLDEELARAVVEAEAVDPIAPPAPPSKRSPADHPKPKRNLGLLIGLLVMVGGLVTLVMTSFEDAAIYSKTVDQLLKEQEKLSGRNVRVEGALVKGSLMRRDDPCEYRFRIQKNGAELAVHYPQCVVPDTFRDMPGMDVAVTAEGKLAEDGHFQASHIMAKCPSKYEMKEKAARGEQAPHASTIPAAGTMPAAKKPIGAAPLDTMPAEANAVRTTSARTP